MSSRPYYVMTIWRDTQFSDRPKNHVVDIPDVAIMVSCIHPYVPHG